MRKQPDELVGFLITPWWKDRWLLLLGVTCILAAAVFIAFYLTTPRNDVPKSLGTEPQAVVYRVSARQMTER